MSGGAWLFLNRILRTSMSLRMLKSRINTFYGLSCLVPKIPLYQNLPDLKPTPPKPSFLMVVDGLGYLPLQLEPSTLIRCSLGVWSRKQLQCTVGYKQR